MTLPTPDEEAVFDFAVKIESPQIREEYLRRICGDNQEFLNRMLGLVQIHLSDDNLLDRPAMELNTTEITHDCKSKSTSVGESIGNYKLLQEIGEGGFGVVYMAEQIQPVRRKIALKVIKPGMDSKEVVARFEAERQALALLDDPNIAKLLDAGTTNAGRPYFAMELVHGVPITEFCDQNKSSLGERIDLFLQVCRAVQHAHVRGIIHRDIKPSNILVTLHDGKPVPKVIDFGVAKALNQQLTEKTLFTAYGQVVGTPQYMSPEQAEMSGLGIDTRSDIYSMGVLLYELLTGAPPIDKDRLLSSGYAEMIRIIREEEPPRPSKRVSTLGGSSTIVAKQRSVESRGLERSLAGDLDWIVMKTLEKERDRRYESVRDLADDLRRHLAQEPVAARAPSVGYRLKKYIVRHRVLVGVAACLAISTALTSLALITAIEDRKRADENERTAMQEAQKNVQLVEEAKTNLVVAQRNETKALDAERQAEAALKRSTRLRYASEMVAASHALAEGDTAQVRMLLDRQPEELRGFEWHYLNHAIRQRWEQEFTTEKVIRDAILHESKSLLVASHLRSPGVAVYQTDGKLIREYAAGALESSRIALRDDLLAYTVSETEVAFASVGEARLSESWTSDAKIAGIAFSPKSGDLAVHTSNGIRIVKVDTRMVVQGLTLDAKPVQVNDRCVAYSADGEWLAASDSGGKVYVWNTASYDRTYEFDIGLSLPRSFRFGVLAFSPTKPLLAVGFSERLIVLDCTTGTRCELAHPQNDFEITALTFLSDGITLAVGDYYGTITLWDVEKRALTDRLAGHEWHVRSLLRQEDGTLLSAGQDAHVKSWSDLSLGSDDVITSSPDSKALGFLGFLPDSRGIVFLDLVGQHFDRFANAVGVPRRIAIWRPDGTIVDTNLRALGAWTALAANGVLARLSDQEVELWDLTQESPILKTSLSLPNTLSGERKPASSQLEISGNGQTICFAEAGQVQVWKYSENRMQEFVIKVEGSDREPHVSLSFDGRFIAVSDLDSIYLWNTVTQKRQSTMNMGTDLISSTAFSPDGRWFAAIDRTGEVAVWRQGEFGASIKTWEAQVGPGLVAFTNQGDRLLTGGIRGRIKMWELEDFRPVCTFSDELWQRRFAMSPDDRTLAIASAGHRAGVLRLYHAPTPSPATDGR